MVEHFPGMEEVVGSSPRGGRNFSHGKLSKIDPLVLKSLMILRQTLMVWISMTLLARMKYHH